MRLGHRETQKEDDGETSRAVKRDIRVLRLAKVSKSLGRDGGQEEQVRHKSDPAFKPMPNSLGLEKSWSKITIQKHVIQTKGAKAKVWMNATKTSIQTLCIHKNL